MNFYQIFDGDISEEKVETWLKQFDVEDRSNAEKLLLDFSYFSYKKVQKLLKQLNTLIENEYYNSETFIWYVPIGYCAKSGSLVAYLYKKANNIPQNSFVSISHLNSIPEFWGITNRCSIIVLIDDFIGTGVSTVALWKKYIAQKVDNIDRQQFVVATLVGLEDGIKYVQENTKLDVIVAEKIKRTQIDSIEIKYLIQKYGMIAYPEEPLGYQDTMSLVSFYFTTPNTTIPIIWAKNANWAPLLLTGNSSRYKNELFEASIEHKSTDVITEIPAESENFFALQYQNAMWYKTNELKEYLLLESFCEVVLVTIEQNTLYLYSGDFYNKKKYLYIIDDTMIDQNVLINEVLNKNYPQYLNSNYEIITKQIRPDSGINSTVVVFYDKEIVDKSYFYHVVINEMIKIYCSNINISTLEPIFIINNAINNLLEQSNAHRLLEIITLLSTELYESNTSKGQIQCIPITERERYFGTKPVILFSDPIPLEISSIRRIRKIFEMSKETALILEYDCTKYSSFASIIGIGNIDGKYKIVILGHLHFKVSTHFDEFRYFKGRYTICSAEKDDSELEQVITDKFSVTKESALMVKNITQVALKKSHGTTIIVTDSALAESMRLCSANRGFLCVPAFLLNSENENFIVSLTAIDGAIIIDANGYCYSFGVILDGEMVVSGTTDRGARYNSALNFIAWKKLANSIINYIAIVLSEDGSIDIITYDNHFKYINNN